MSYSRSGSPTKNYFTFIRSFLLLFYRDNNKKWCLTKYFANLVNYIGYFFCIVHIDPSLLYNLNVSILKCIHVCLGSQVLKPKHTWGDMSNLRVWISALLLADRTPRVGVPERGFRHPFYSYDFCMSANSDQCQICGSGGNKMQSV